MTNRERAMNLLHYKAVDRLPAVHFGYWDELLIEWTEQGKIPKRLSEVNRDGSPQDEELDRLIYESCADAQLLSKTVTAELTDTSVVLHCEILCICNIAAKEEFSPVASQ